MNMTETVFHWLAGVPALEGLQRESLEATPGSCGLFCKGEQLLWEKQDILGSRLRRRRLTFLLVRHGLPGEHCPMEQLAELALPTAPSLGADQTVAMEKGRLSRDDGSGTPRFQAQITFTFTTKEV